MFLLDIGIKTKTKVDRKQGLRKKIEKVPFLKRNSVRVILALIGVIFISGIAFTASLYSTGKRVFDSGDGDGPKSFLRGISSSAKLKGEDEGRINILIMGIGGSNHPGGQLTDSMMIVSLKPADGALAMLSVPRDLYVPIADHRAGSKLNEVYATGDKEKKGSGPALVKKTLNNILGIPIHYYVTVDFAGFEKLINEAGGVDVYVDKTLYDPLYPDAAMKGYEPFYIRAGQQHLDGKTALKYARSRETTSDFDRSARQQKIAVALKEKILNLGFLANPKKIYDLVNLVSDHTRTDFSPAEIKELAKMIKKINNDKIFSKVLTSGADGPLISDSSSGTYYLRPKTEDFDEVADIAKGIFDDPNANKEKASIEVLNGTKTAGAAIRASDEIKDLGYRITNIGNAKGSYQKTTIIDYTDGVKKKTVEILKSALNATVIQKSPDKNTQVEITVIIGDDYRPMLKSPSKPGETTAEY